MPSYSGHPNLGWLQGGKAGPAEYHLDRLRRLSERFVMAFRMADGELPAAWVVFEQCGDPLWREAGLERKARYEQAGDALSAGISLAIWAQCEGLHWAAEYGEHVAFTEHFYEGLQALLRDEENQAWKAKVTASIRASEAQDVREEARTNPAYLERLRAKHPELAEMLMTMGQDEFSRIVRGRTLASVAGARPRALTEGAA